MTFPPPRAKSGTYQINSDVATNDQVTFYPNEARDGTSVASSNAEEITPQTTIRDLAPIINEPYIPSPKNINWLGSSYSGVDIKVIAHLYRNVTKPNQRLTKLKHDMDVAQTIADSCEKLLSGGLAAFLTETAADETWNNKVVIFNKMAGLEAGGGGDESVIAEARSHLIGTILVRARFGSIQEIAKVKGNLIGIKTANQQLASQLQEDLTKMKEIEEEASDTVVLATLQTLSIQSHREKVGVRALGHSYAKGYVRGQRSIAGSMIFTLLNEHPLSVLQRAMGAENSMWKDPELSTILPDQLPPIDLTIAFANEYGHISELRLYGVEFVNDGTTFSIEDLFSENVMQFVCRDADVLTDKGKVKLSRLQRGILHMNDFEGQDITGSDLINNQSYQEYLGRLGIRRRFSNR